MNHEESSNEYEVEEILDERYFKDKPFYLIKWKGFPESQSTWEPIENMKNALTYLIAWKKQRIVDNGKVSQSHHNQFNSGNNEKKCIAKNNLFLQQREANNQGCIKPIRKILCEKPWKKMFQTNRSQKGDQNMCKVKKRLKKCKVDFDQELSLSEWPIKKMKKVNEAPVKIQCDTSNQSRKIVVQPQKKTQSIKQTIRQEKLQKFDKIEEQKKGSRNLTFQPKEFQIKISKAEMVQQQKQEKITISNEYAPQQIQNPKSVQQCSHERSLHQSSQIASISMPVEKIIEVNSHNYQIVPYKSSFEDNLQKKLAEVNKNQPKNPNQQDQQYNSIVEDLRQSSQSSSFSKQIQEASTAIRTQQLLSPIKNLEQLKNDQPMTKNLDNLQLICDFEVSSRLQKPSVSRIVKTFYTSKEKIFQVELLDKRDVLISHQSMKSIYPEILCDYYEQFLSQSEINKQQQAPSH